MTIPGRDSRRIHTSLRTLGRSDPLRRTASGATVGTVPTVLSASYYRHGFGLFHVSDNSRPGPGPCHASAAGMGQPLEHSGREETLAPKIPPAEWRSASPLPVIGGGPVQPIP